MSLRATSYQLAARCAHARVWRVLVWREEYAVLPPPACPRPVPPFPLKLPPAAWPVICDVRSCASPHTIRRQSLSQHATGTSGSSLNARRCSNRRSHAFLAFLSFLADYAALRALRCVLRSAWAMRHARLRGTGCRASADSARSSCPVLPRAPDRRSAQQ